MTRDQAHAIHRAYAGSRYRRRRPVVRPLLYLAALILLAVAASMP